MAKFSKVKVIGENITDEYVMGRISGIAIGLGSRDNVYGIAGGEDNRIYSIEKSICDKFVKRIKANYPEMEIWVQH